jgi:hypothetical protein
MAADGLTKGLIKQKNKTFIRQLNLVDISSALVPNRQSECAIAKSHGNKGIKLNSGTTIGV